MPNETEYDAAEEIKQTLNSNGELPVVFKPSLTPDEYVENSAARLNGLQKWLHDAEVSKIRKDHIIKVARAMFEFHYQDMQHVLVLGMDVGKKIRFQQYMTATAKLSHTIQRQSSEAQSNVIQNLVDQLVRADMDRNKNGKSIDAKVSSGKLTVEQGEVHKKIHSEFYDALRLELRNTSSVMINQHKEFLHKTLESFKAGLLE
jgi:hypothetical protein